MFPLTRAATNECISWDAELVQENIWTIMLQKYFYLTTDGRVTQADKESGYWCQCQATTMSEILYH